MLSTFLVAAFRALETTLLGNERGLPAPWAKITVVEQVGNDSVAVKRDYFRICLQTQLF
jgi:hypothetical protein